MDTEKIRQEIETLKCQKHNKYPFLIFLPENIKLTNVCCNEFEEELKSKLAHLTSEKAAATSQGAPSLN